MKNNSKKKKISDIKKLKKKLLNNPWFKKYPQDKYKTCF